MRVIAGERKGLQLKSLKGSNTRPTSNKVKESIFNIIGPFFNGGLVVELFGGSGALSIEAVSRGMDKAIIFEKNRKACHIIQENVDKCRYEEKIHIERADAKISMPILKHENKEIDLLFVDPPYAEEKFYEIINKLVEENLLAPHAVIVCEHDKQVQLPINYGPYIKVKNVIYGNISISIYEK